MRKLDRALVCTALLGAAMAAAPARGAVYSAIERGPTRPVQAATLERGNTLHAAAQQAEPKVDPCPASADWTVLRECLENRKRQLFEPVPPEGKELTAAERARFRAVPTEAPATLPLTFEEQLDQSKAQTLRRFENELNLDFQREFRDFLDTR